MIVQRDRHKDAIDYALNILKSEPFIMYIEKIYLFGSCARKQNKFTSDVDILIQCNDRLNPDIARKMRIAVMPEVTDLPEVDLKFTTKPDLKKQSDQFSKNLVKEAILLWEKK